MSKKKMSHAPSEDHLPYECNIEGNDVNVQEAVSSLRALVSGEINAVLLHSAFGNFTALYKAKLIHILNLGIIWS
jgi:hypothetical protein